MQMFPMNNGLFAHIHYEFPDILTITDAELDLTFLTLWGLRYCAPVVHVVHEDEDISQLTDSELTILASLILDMYKHKWDRLSELIVLRYDPIHNYSDTYHEELEEGITGESTRTPDISIANNETVEVDTVLRDGGSERRNKTTSGTDTREDDLREETNGADVHNRFAFNSAENEAVGDSVDESTGVKTNEGTVTDTRSGTEETTITGGLTHTTDGTNVTSGTKRTTGTEANEHSSDRNRVRDSTHVGNIGNLTTQQLMTQEIELWRWNLIQQVLNDVKDFLTLPVYE